MKNPVFCLVHWQSHLIELNHQVIILDRELIEMINLKSSFIGKEIEISKNIDKIYLIISEIRLNGFCWIWHFYWVSFWEGIFIKKKQCPKFRIQIIFNRDLKNFITNYNVYKIADNSSPRKLKGIAIEPLRLILKLVYQ